MIVSRVRTCAVSHRALGVAAQTKVGVPSSGGECVVHVVFRWPSSEPQSDAFWTLSVVYTIVVTVYHATISVNNVLTAIHGNHLVLARLDS